MPQLTLIEVIQKLIVASQKSVIEIQAIAASEYKSGEGWHRSLFDLLQTSCEKRHHFPGPSQEVIYKASIERILLKTLKEIETTAKNVRFNLEDKDTVQILSYVCFLQSIITDAGFDISAFPSAFRLLGEKYPEIQTALEFIQSPAMSDNAYGATYRGILRGDVPLEGFSFDLKGLPEFLKDYLQLVFLMTHLGRVYLTQPEQARYQQFNALIRIYGLDIQPVTDYQSSVIFCMELINLCRRQFVAYGIYAIADKYQDSYVRLCELCIKIIAKSDEPILFGGYKSRLLILQMLIKLLMHKEKKIMPMLSIDNLEVKKLSLKLIKGMKEALIELLNAGELKLAHDLVSYTNKVIETAGLDLRHNFNIVLQLTDPFHIVFDEDISGLGLNICLEQMPKESDEVYYKRFVFNVIIRAVSHYMANDGLNMATKLLSAFLQGMSFVTDKQQKNDFQTAKLLLLIQLFHSNTSMSEKCSFLDEILSQKQGFKVLLAQLDSSVQKYFGEAVLSLMSTLAKSSFEKKYCFVRHEQLIRFKVKMESLLLNDIPLDSEQIKTLNKQIRLDLFKEQQSKNIAALFADDHKSSKKPAPACPKKKKKALSKMSKLEQKKPAPVTIPVIDKDEERRREEQAKNDRARALEIKLEDAVKKKKKKKKKPSQSEQTSMVSSSSSSSSPQRDLTQPNFFQVNPLDAMIPDALWQLSKLIDKISPNPLILTGGAVEHIYLVLNKIVHPQGKKINDYDCLVDMDLTELRAALLEKEYEVSEVIGKKHQLIAIKVGSIEIEISALRGKGSLEKRLGEDANHRDIRSTGMYLLLQKPLKIFDPLNAQAALDRKEGEINLQEGFYSEDPIRLLRLAKWLIKWPELSLSASSQKMISSIEQKKVWNEYLYDREKLSLHRGRVLTALRKLVDYDPKALFESLNQVGLLSGLLGIDEISLQDFIEIHLGVDYEDSLQKFYLVVACVYFRPHAESGIQLSDWPFFTCIREKNLFFNICLSKIRDYYVCGNDIEDLEHTHVAFEMTSLYPGKHQMPLMQFK